jgi:hypothetical protein
VFNREREALLQEGVHRIAGYVFATTTVRIQDGTSEALRDSAMHRAELRGTGELVKFRVGECLDAGRDSTGYRRAVTDLAASCLGEPVPLRGIVRVWADAGASAATVVQAVPAVALDALVITREEVTTCLTERIREGTAPPSAPLVLRELEGSTPEDPAGSRRRLASALARVFGPGVEVGLSDGWTSADGRICGECLAGWITPVEAVVSRVGVIGTSLEPISIDVLEQLTLDELMVLFAQRVHDSGVEAAVVTRLRDAGFACSAAEFALARHQLKPPADASTSAIPNDLRAEVVSAPVVMVLLLTDGVCAVQWDQQAPPWLAAARAAFDEPTPQGRERSIRLIADGLGHTPNVDGVSLLAAALLDADDAVLAEPLARAAFLAMPRHEFAGINALRAARALGMRDRAKELFPRVAAEARLGAWGRAQLNAVAAWLGLPDPNPSERLDSAPSVPTDPPPVPSTTSPPPSTPPLDHRRPTIRTDASPTAHAENRTFRSTLFG